MIAPLGGGGLLAGVAVALKSTARRSFQLSVFRPVHGVEKSIPLSSYVP